MPRGRQAWKYNTPEERAEARRERVRLNVRALRERRKVAEAAAKRSAGEAGFPDDTNPASTKKNKEFKFVVATTAIKKRTRAKPRTTDHDDLEDVEAVAKEQILNPSWQYHPAFVTWNNLRLHSPGWFDVTTHSAFAPVDLEFDAVPALVTSFLTGIPERSSFTRALIDDRADDDRLVEIALSSAGSQVLGRLRNDHKLLSYSTNSYHKSCTLLRQRYTNPGWPAQAPIFTIVTTTLYLISLLLSFTDKRTDHWVWPRHLRGIGAVLRTAGPSTFRTRLGIEVFRASRPSIILTSITSQEVCFLDSPEWRNVPISKIPRTAFARAQDTFWDLAARVATAVWRINNELARLYTPGSTHANRDTAMVLAGHLNELREEFRRWFLQTQTEMHNQLFAEVTAAPTSSDYIFRSGKVFHFRDLAAAELLTSYWTYAFYLWDVSTFYHRALTGLPTSIHLPVEWMVPPADVEYFAIMICQCIWWFMSWKAPSSTLSLYASFPLRVATMYFHKVALHRPEELEWCVETSERIAGHEMEGGLAEFFVDAFVPPIHRVQRPT